MKNLVIAFFGLFVFFAATAQSPATFAETKHDFGKIKQHVPATYVFTFTNNTDKPLIVESAQAGCGCTTPEFPKQPIAKGKTGTIKVTYNAEATGTFTKDVNVKFLNTQQPVVLVVSGEVLAADVKAVGTKQVSKKLAPAPKKVPAKL